MPSSHSISPSWAADTVPIVTVEDLVNADNANASVIDIANKIGYLKQQLIDSNNLNVSNVDRSGTFIWHWGTEDVDPNVAGTNVSIRLTGNATINIAGLTTGTYAAIRIEQDSVGSKIYNFGSAAKGLLDFSQSLTPNAVDWLLFRAKDASTCELVGFRNNVGV